MSIQIGPQRQLGPQRQPRSQHAFSGASTPGRDDGITLIELLVTSMLGLLVLSIIGGIIISTTTAQASISSVNAATVAGQLVATSLQRQIRNSQVSYTASATPTAASPTFMLTPVLPNDQLLVALVAGSGATYTESCAAWFYSATARTISYRTSASAITAPGSNASGPNASGPNATGGWQVLASGVSPLNGGAVFASVANANVPSSISANFTVDAARGKSVPFQVTALSRTGLFASGKSCY